MHRGTLKVFFPMFVHSCFFSMSVINLNFKASASSRHIASWHSRGLCILYHDPLKVFDITKQSPAVKQIRMSHSFTRNLLHVSGEKRCENLWMVYNFPILFVLHSLQILQSDFWMSLVLYSKLSKGQSNKSTAGWDFSVRDRGQKRSYSSECVCVFVLCVRFPASCVLTRRLQMKPYYLYFPPGNAE